MIKSKDNLSIKVKDMRQNELIIAECEGYVAHEYISYYQFYSASFKTISEEEYLCLDLKLVVYVSELNKIRVLFNSDKPVGEIFPLIAIRLTNGKDKTIKEVIEIGLQNYLNKNNNFELVSHKSTLYQIIESESKELTRDNKRKIQYSIIKDIKNISPIRYINTRLYKKGLSTKITMDVNSADNQRPIICKFVNFPLLNANKNTEVLSFSNTKNLSPIFQCLGNKVLYTGKQEFEYKLLFIARMLLKENYIMPVFIGDYYFELYPRFNEEEILKNTINEIKSLTVESNQPIISARSDNKIVKTDTVKIKPKYYPSDIVKYERNIIDLMEYQNTFSLMVIKDRNSEEMIQFNVTRCDDDYRCSDGATMHIIDKNGNVVRDEIMLFNRKGQCMHYDFIHMNTFEVYEIFSIL